MDMVTEMCGGSAGARNGRHHIGNSATCVFAATVNLVISYYASGGVFIHMLLIGMRLLNKIATE